MNKTYVLGIDPGATGALALFCPEDGLIKGVWDMPNTQMTLTTGKKTNRVNIKALIKLFLEIQDKVHYEKVSRFIVHIEKVQAFGKQSAPAAFNFGVAAAIPQTIAETFGLEIIMIPPQTWKRQFNLQASVKSDSRLLVQKMFPSLFDTFKLVKHTDRADAVLIACYQP